MSSFICEHCGTAIRDTKNGYVTWCEHWPEEKIMGRQGKKSARPPAKHEGRRQYVPKPGLIAEVSSGLTNGKLWFAVTRAASGGAHRINNKYLPLRKDRETAQADLDKYAGLKGWPLCD